MSANLAAAEVSTEAVIPRIDKTLENPSPNLASRLKNALRRNTPREILESASSQAKLEEEYIEKNVLKKAEKQEIGKLRTTANYLWGQRAVFGLMAVYPTLELVKNFTGLEIPDSVFSIVKHGANAGIGSLIVSGGEGHVVSRVLRKSLGAAGFAVGAHGLEKISGIPGTITGLVDDVVAPPAQAVKNFIQGKR